MVGGNFEAPAQGFRAAASLAGDQRQVFDPPRCGERAMERQAQEQGGMPVVVSQGFGDRSKSRLGIGEPLQNPVPREIADDHRRQAGALCGNAGQGGDVADRQVDIGFTQRQHLGVYQIGFSLLELLPGSKRGAQVDA